MNTVYYFVFSAKLWIKLIIRRDCKIVPLAQPNGRPTLARILLLIGKIPMITFGLLLTSESSSVKVVSVDDSVVIINVASHVSIKDAIARCVNRGSLTIMTI